MAVIGGGGQAIASLLLQTERRKGATSIDRQELCRAHQPNLNPAAFLGSEYCYSILDRRYRTRGLRSGCCLSSQGSLCSNTKLPLTSKLNTWAQETGRPTVLAVTPGKPLYLAELSPSPVSGLIAVLTPRSVMRVK